MPSDSRSKFRKVATVFILVFALLVFFREKILNLAGEAIAQNDSSAIVDGDLGILLMGDHTGERANAAIQFLEKYPHSNVVIGPEEQSNFVALGLLTPMHLVHLKFLLSAGISENRIIIPDCLDTSTLDEAVCLRNYMETNKPDTTNIVVITSWYHSSRAAWTFRKVFSGTNINIKALPATSERSSPERWWTREQSFLLVFNEYLKWTYWLLRASTITYTAP